MFLIKWGFIIGVIFILINIFSPDTSSKINQNISDTTGIKKETLDKNLNDATDVAKSLPEKFKDRLVDEYEKNKEKIKNLNN